MGGAFLSWGVKMLSMLAGIKIINVMEIGCISEEMTCVLWKRAIIGIIKERGTCKKVTNISILIMRNYS